ncbi:hypothetical protein J2S74_002751 [Evansella vedderi]|uniref:Uncharacterized protein n=1 Tax=Evansella vedderi TaxID=38282 RepID=A0ABT9ZWX5_9BACI|nr:hypothetical protein [Evansella vedderi]MDQ0255369.1 hypothetical protein [Evansella vedderi]
MVQRRTEKKLTTVSRGKEVKKRTWTGSHPRKKKSGCGCGGRKVRKST